MQGLSSVTHLPFVAGQAARIKTAGSAHDSKSPPDTAAQRASTPSSAQNKGPSASIFSNHTSRLVGVEELVSAEIIYDDPARRHGNAVSTLYQSVQSFSDDDAIIDVRV